MPAVGKGGNTRKFTVHFFDPLLAKRFDGEIKEFNRLDNGMYQISTQNDEVIEIHGKNIVIFGK